MYCAASGNRTQNEKRSAEGPPLACLPGLPGYSAHVKQQSEPSPEPESDVL